MAILETIRNKGGVLITVVIGLALFAFILGDFLNPRGSSISGSKLDVAKVKGQSITINELEAQIDELSEFIKLSNGTNTLDESSMEYVREQAFEMMVTKIIFDSEYEDLGLAVSGDELFDLVQGENPHQAVRQMFTDPKTGLFNKSVLISFLKNKNQDPSGKQQMYWMFMEKQILNDQLSNKYANLIRKGLYVPGFMSRNEALANSKLVNFDFVVQRYTSIADSAVKITMADLKKYYNEHPKNWEQIPSRDIEYIAFNTYPSESDREAVLKDINKLRADFVATTNEEQFLSLNSDAPYVNRNYSLQELPVQAATLFDAAPGTVEGPYEENNAFMLAKLIKVVSVPDSVRARHILIQPKANNQMAMDQAKNLADSLKIVIEKGGNFAIMAMSHSADQGSLVNGGDLGWFQQGAMVPEFDAPAFSQAKGEVSVVQSQYGFHVLQVTDRSPGVKKVQVAILQKDISASSETMQKIYSQASQFAGENHTSDKFSAAARTENLSILKANYLRENDRKIGILGSAREIVRWAFGAKMNEVSDVFTLEQTYVVARVSAVRDQDKAPLEQVKSELDIMARKEKKAEILTQKMAEAKTGKSELNDVATQLKTPVESATDISFSSFAVPSAGMEPNVVAAATSLNLNVISSPIKGNIGIFLLQVKSVKDSTQNINAAVNRIRLDYETRAGSDAMQTLRKLANVKDLRSKFY